jgi:hypothetical protein
MESGWIETSAAKIRSAHARLFTPVATHLHGMLNGADGNGAWQGVAGRAIS